VLAVPLAALVANPQTVVLDVKNITRQLCAIAGRKALGKMPGVANAKIDFDKKTATVKFDLDKINTGALVKATSDARYPFTTHK